MMLSPAALPPRRDFRLPLGGLATADLDGWSGGATVESTKSPQPLRCSLRYLVEDDLDGLLALQQRVHAALENKDLFRCVPPERHALYLRRRGRSAGAFLDGRLIAYSSVQFPVPFEENQGREIGLSAADLERVCQMEGIVVDPAYRGRRISRLLNEMRLRYAEAAGFDIAVATISPFNRYSLMSFVPTGFLVKGLREGPGSLLRYLVSDRMDRDAVPLDDATVTVPTGDLDTQKRLLADGYWGCRPLLGEAGLAMAYARFRLVPRADDRRRCAG